jgi:hypothetical protein
MQTSATEKQLIVSRTAELRQLTKEAKQFFAEAEKQRASVEAGVASALDKAWQCGKRLNAIKAIVGHGNWLPWLENHWPELPERTAQLYMKIDRDNPNTQRVADLEFDTVRKYALGFVPEKEEPNKGRDVKFPRLVSMLNIANEYNRLKYRHVNGLQSVDFKEAREETGELYLFLRWLHGDSKLNPWEENRTPPRR